MNFNKLCTYNTQSREQESVDYPLSDWVQDGWLASLEYLQDIDDAATIDELRSSYQKNAGLVVTCFKRAMSSALRQTKGNEFTPRKKELVNSFFSLDACDQSGTPYSDLIEDMQAEIPFRQVEDIDLIYNDERLRTLTDEQRAAVQRFTVAWLLQEAGYDLPNTVSKRLSRDRKLTGLPLVLKKGRKT